MLIGAGTVLHAESCDLALTAGARLIVSPTYNPEVVQLTKRRGPLSLPGALTPNEVLAAWEGGADLVKIFPCGFLGGAQYIRALKAPFPEVHLVPTAGVNLENIAEFFAAGVTTVGVGEKIFNHEAIQKRDVALIASQARRFMDAIESAIS